VVELKILNGKKAGTQWVARRFPVQIGRSPTCELCLQEDGIWERHLEIHLQSPMGFVLSASPEALVALNGQLLKQAVLRSGDIIELGPVLIRFGLSATQQRGLRLREFLTWFALGLLCLGQIALIYWLLE
jgi:hypothetical protein